MSLFNGLRGIFREKISHGPSPRAKPGSARSGLMRKAGIGHGDKLRPPSDFPQEIVAGRSLSAVSSPAWSDQVNERVLAVQIKTLGSREAMSQKGGKRTVQRFAMQWQGSANSCRALRRRHAIRNPSINGQFARDEFTLDRIDQLASALPCCC